MNPAVLGPHHLAVQVSDLGAAERFYHGVLGLEVIKRWPYEDGRPGERSLWLRLGQMFIALERCDQKPAPTEFRDPQARLHLFAVRIAARERKAWEERLLAAGVEIVHRSRWTLYVRDPDGNRIGLSHHPHDEAEERALPATGGARERGALAEERALPATGGARERGALEVGSEFVERLRGQGINDERVLEAFGRVDRAAFVPPESRARAGEDRPLEIGLGQTISQPYIVALMTQSLQISPGQRVLEIGTGSGYQTAILAALGAEVFSIELLPELARRAADTLRAQGFGGITLRVGDGALGWPEQAPFDAILVAAAPGEVPPALLEQLAPRGRLVIPVGDDLDGQELELWTKDAPAGGLRRRTLGLVRFVPLRSGR
jgi:protein-L-isoaspartate(D-aspartate) O-methyltransferase